MKITFIAHSAFLVEWDKFYTLFDYVYEPDYTGTLPPLDPQKPLLVFSSHSHEDHFDGKVFGLLEQYPLTQFFVSRDTRLTERRRKWLGISDEAFARTTVLRPDSILLTEAAGEELTDRFGEPPKNVQNLLAVAELKALAHCAYVTELKQMGDSVRVTLQQHAKIDVARIPELLQKYRDELKFQMESLAFVYTPRRRNSKEKIDLLEKSHALVEDLLQITQE